MCCSGSTGVYVDNSTIFVKLVFTLIGILSSGNLSNVRGVSRFHVLVLVLRDPAGNPIRALGIPECVEFSPED